MKKNKRRRARRAQRVRHNVREQVENPSQWVPSPKCQQTSLSPSKDRELPKELTQIEYPTKTVRNTLQHNKPMQHRVTALVA